jgi:uncharacterized protein YecT (DUF1311 family)
MMKSVTLAAALARGAFACALAAMLVVGSVAARAEVAAADPIDASMRTCLARADMSSTAGQVQCMETARLAWQASVDQSFQQVLAKVPAAQRAKWDESQRRWKAWREADSKLLAAVIATTHGTRYVLSEADMQLQPVRDRALVLRSVAAKTGGVDPLPRLRACSADAQCVHANADMNRYYWRLRQKMPPHSRAILMRAQRAWVAYRDATVTLGSALERVDLIGARVATLKKLADTADND